MLKSIKKYEFNAVQIINIVLMLLLVIGIVSSRVQASNSLEMHRAIIACDIDLALKIDEDNDYLGWLDSQYTTAVELSTCK